MSRTLHHGWLLLLLVSSTAAADFKWIDDKSNPGYNCAGKVTDALCCQDNVCNAGSEAECKSGSKQFLCSWTGGRCRSFRDSSNNVCCQSEVKDACKKILEGVCPEDWQVPENCCSGLAAKYQGVLTGVKPGYVCCNAPCSEMKKAGCALPEKCTKPTPRGFGYNPMSQLGFNNAQMIGQQMSIGNVLSGTGFGGDYGAAILAGLGDTKSKGQQVDEITVDDMMSMLIDALSDDKDAMVYNSEINSDPYMGKQRSGGALASMNLPSPNFFLDQLYGNPFAMSGGNMFGSFPSMPNFYPQAMLGLPTPTSPYAATPYYPQLPFPGAAVPGTPQQFQPQPPPQQMSPQQFMMPPQFQGQSMMMPPQFQGQSMMPPQFQGQPMMQPPFMMSQGWPVGMPPGQAYGMAPQYVMKQ